MWAGILAIFPTVAGWINLVISFFQQRAAQQDSATKAENAAEAAHNADGAQSVADQNSIDAQDQALNQEQSKLENPVPAVVTLPKGSG